MKYRADIDGLRAIAVISVLAFHLNERFLSGGFVGVDIFFVISGYLITKLIVSEISDSGAFSFKTFYLRRARRLFPALFCTFVICLVLAYFLFSPQHLASFGKSVVFATTSLSNFLFWSESSYFDQENIFKPLLHTWSLSIEEQFYFIWPALLCALCFYTRSKYVPLILFLIGVLSLYLTHAFIVNEEALINRFSNKESGNLFEVRSTIFYLLPFRVFEFVLGAILVWVPNLKNRFYRDEILFVLGIGLMAYALFFFTEGTVFPSFNALLPCVGASLIIYSGPNHVLSGLLKNKLMVSVGLISYSLYLIHWPVIVFYAYWKFEALASMDYVVISSISIIAAIFMYRYIEQPFRKPKSGAGQPNKPFVYAAILLSTALCLTAWNAHSSSGWLWRYPADVIKQLEFKQGDYKLFFWEEMIARQGGFSNNGKSKVLIVGDSMAADLVNAIGQGGHAEQLDIATFKVEHHCLGLLPMDVEYYQKNYGGRKDLCYNEHTRLKNDPRLKEADAIVLASYWWANNHIKLLAQTIDKLKQHSDATILVSGVKDQISNGMLFFTKNISSPRIDKLRTPAHPNTLVMNHAMRNLEGDFVYFDLLDQFCGSEGCQRVTKGGHVIIFDGSHMSPQGAKFVGQNLDKTEWFNVLIEAGK